MATAPVNSYIVYNNPEDLKEKVDELKRKFHLGRLLEITNLPFDVTMIEIRELLPNLSIEALHLRRNKMSCMAHAVVHDPGMLEEWDEHKKFSLRGNRVNIALMGTKGILCVARLPFTFTESQFTTLVTTYGKVCRSFLMISEKTGFNKGYGFVEYTTNAAALVAKAMLDGRQIENFCLSCDWLDPKLIKFNSLHSKCLYVDHLPRIEDRDELRKLFSAVTSPLYCQVATINKCPQDWALVEYNSSNEAEMAQEALNGFSFNGQNIRVFFSLPGVRAINLYLKFLNLYDRKDRYSGLLPDPSPSSIVYHLRNLFKNNASFAKSLIKIIDKTQYECIKKWGYISRNKNSAGDDMMVNSRQVTQNSLDASVLVLASRILEKRVGKSELSLEGNPQILAAILNLMTEEDSGSISSSSLDMSNLLNHGPSTIQANNGMGAMSNPDLPFTGHPVHFLQPSTEQLWTTTQTASFANPTLMPNMTTVCPIPGNPFPGPRHMFSSTPLPFNHPMIHNQFPLIVPPIVQTPPIQSEWTLPVVTNMFVPNALPIQFGDYYGQNSVPNPYSPPMTDFSLGPNPSIENNSESGAEIPVDWAAPEVEILPGHVTPVGQNEVNQDVQADWVSPIAEILGDPLIPIGQNGVNNVQDVEAGWISPIAEIHGGHLIPIGQNGGDNPADWVSPEPDIVASEEQKRVNPYNAAGWGTRNVRNRARRYLTPASQVSSIEEHSLQPRSANFAQRVAHTRRRKRRNYSLPSVDQNYNRSYVGQHSQGLVGHYVDSFIRYGKNHRQMN